MSPPCASEEVADALAPYSPCDENSPADTLMNYVRTAFVFGMTGTTEYIGVGFHERFMALSRFQRCGSTKIWCASVSDACNAFRATGLNTVKDASSTASVFKCLNAKQAAACHHQGLKLFHCIADEGDVVILPSGWLLAEKPLNSQTILGISVGALPAAGSLDDFVHFRRIGDLLAFHNPSSSAVASVDMHAKSKAESH